MRLPLRIGLALLVVASMGVIVGSSGFTSTQADRAVTVNIVEDGDAYVGLVYDDEVTVDVTDADVIVDENITNFTATYENASTVRNQFVVDVNVTVEVVEHNGAPETEYVLNESASSDGVKPGSNGEDAFVPVGEVAVFDAEVSCETVVDGDGVGAHQQSGNVTVEYNVDGSGVSASIEREVTVTCDGDPTL